MANNLILGEIEETLYLTPEGKFFLEIVADGCKTRPLTRKEAEAWYEKHFPGEKLVYC